MSIPRTSETNVIAALDEVEAIADLLWALFLVGEGIGGTGGGAVARTALLAQDRVQDLRAALDGQ